MAGPTIDVEYRAKTQPLEQGLKSATATAKSTTKSIGTIAAGVFGGTLATKAASSAASFFKGAITGAMNAEDANVRFATSLKNIANASPATISQVNSFLGSLSKTAAVSKGELRPAFESLLRGTGDVGKAQAALKIALDASAGSGKPLSAVAQAMTRGFQGNVGALGRLGIATKQTVPNLTALKHAQEGQASALKAYAEAVKKHGANSEQAIKAQDKLRTATEKVKGAQEQTKKQTLGMDAVMKEMSRTFGGQAAKQADTAAGRMKNAQLQFKAMQVTVGQALMPIILQLTGILQKTLIPALTFLANLAKKYPGLFQAMAAAVLILVAALKFYVAVQNEGAIATKVWAAAVWLWNAAMAANPIVLIIAAIVALVAIIVIVLVKMGLWQTVVDAVWNAIQVAFHAIVAAGQWLWNWFASNWPTLLAILTGPIGIAVLLIVRYWDGIKNAFSVALSFIRNIVSTVFGWIAGFVSAAFNRVASVITGAMNVIRSIISVALGIVRAVWQGYVSYIQGLIGIVRGILGRIGDAFMIPVRIVQSAVGMMRSAFEGFINFLSGIFSRIGGIASSIAGAVKGPINAVIRAWNALEFTIPKVSVGPIHFGGQTIGLPDIPTLAKGGLTKTAGLAYLHPAEVISPAPDSVTGAAGRGPAVNIENAHFSEQVDVDLFMRRVAWAVRVGVT